MVLSGDLKMKKERVRINLDISKELNEKLRKQADKQDMTMNALIRIALEKYLKELFNFKTAIVEIKNIGFSSPNCLL